MLQGILALVLASLIFGIVPSINKSLLIGGMTAGSVVCLSQLLISLISFSVAGIRKIPLKVTGRQFLTIYLVGAVGMGATGFLLNMSYTMIPVGLATMIHFFYPALTTIVMALFFRQRLNLFKLSAILLSSLGMLLIADVGGGGIDSLGTLFALLSSVTYALYLIANDRSLIREIPLNVKLAYAALGSATLNFVLALCQGGLTLPQTPIQVLTLFGSGGLGMMTAFYCLTIGIQRLGATTSAFFTLLEPLASLIAGIILYDDSLSTLAWVGCSLVLLSVMSIALDGFRAAKPPAGEPAETPATVNTPDS